MAADTPITTYTATQVFNIRDNLATWFQNNMSLNDNSEAYDAAEGFIKAGYLSDKFATDTN